MENAIVSAKLAKQNAGRPREECNGNEHGTEHQRGGDDGAGDLAGGGSRRFVGVVFRPSDMRSMFQSRQ